MIWQSSCGDFVIRYAGAGNPSTEGTDGKDPGIGILKLHTGILLRLLTSTGSGGNCRQRWCQIAVHSRLSLLGFLKSLVACKLSLLIMQHGIPAYIAHNARCLFRECLRRADYIGSQNGNREVLKSIVREQFRRNMQETDSEKIEEQKQAAARALFHHMYYEAGRMAAQHAEAAMIKEGLLGLPRPALGVTLQDEDNNASR